MDAEPATRAGPPARDGLPRKLFAAALAWSVLVLVVGAATLTAENGAGVLIPLAGPLVVVVLLGAIIVARGAWGRPGPGASSWVILSLLFIFALAGMLSIGPFVLPVFVLLLTACARLQTSRRLGL